MDIWMNLKQFEGHSAQKVLQAWIFTSIINRLSENISHFATMKVSK